MKIGFLADAHGNPFGLKLCLLNLWSHGVRKVYFLGDAVGYFPDGLAVLKMLRKHDAKCLMGNHEAMLLGRLSFSAESDRILGMQETRRRVGDGWMRDIEKWRDKTEIVEGRRRIVCMHGEPDAPLTGRLYPDADLSRFESFEADVLVTAHTHWPFIDMAGNVLIVNPGSAGLPRQGGGRASSAIYDTESGTARLLYVSLPVDKLSNFYAGAIHQSVHQVLRR
jgi:putative phosphoesterase